MYKRQIVGADGETHQGLFDVSMLRMVPGTVIYSPATYRQLEADLAEAVDNGTGICAVRYPKGAQPALTASVLGAVSYTHLDVYKRQA